MTPTLTGDAEVTIDDQTFVGTTASGDMDPDTLLVAPVNWTIYAMETGLLKGVRRYSVAAVTPEEAIETILARHTTIDAWDEVTFDVFVEGSGLEFRYERRLRQIHP